MVLEIRGRCPQIVDRENCIFRSFYFLVFAVAFFLPDTNTAFEDNGKRVLRGKKIGIRGFDNRPKKAEYDKSINPVSSKRRTIRFSLSIRSG